jgi:DNA-binding SARP family transcriptional activator
VTTTAAIRVLGPLEVVVDGDALPLGGPKQRIVLALLLAEPNRVVSVDRMIDAIWGEDAVERAAGTVQVYVSNLRRALSPAAAAFGVDDFILTQRPGYVARVTAAQLDLLEFDEALARGRQAAAAGNPAKAAAELRHALGLWRGVPIADLADAPFAAGIVARLEAMRVAAEEERFEAELALGVKADLVAELAALVEANPFNERLRGLLMVALYRSGRQADALAAYQEGRRVLADELGIDPSPALRELEGRILAQDPRLDGAATGQVDLELGTIVRSSVVIPSAVLVHGDQTVSLNRPVTTIGRRADRDVVLDDTQSSRLHAEIRVGPSGFTLVDLGSTNGTSVNGDRVREHVLRPGDEIVIGQTRLRFELSHRG